MAKAAKKQFDIVVPEVKAGKRYYEIKGTGIYGETKEQLKGVRTNLNEGAGIFEKETKKGEETIAATSSNAWPFRITKGPDHPHLNNTFR